MPPERVLHVLRRIIESWAANTQFSSFCAKLAESLACLQQGECYDS